MPLFTQVRGIGILRTSRSRSSEKLAVSYGSGQPAVHADVLPRDVARVLGEEEARRLRDLRNRTPPAHRYRLSGLFVYLEALYVARQHVVHPDALCCVAVGVELGEAGQGSAQGGGEGEGGGGLEGGDGGDVDDSAAPCRSIAGVTSRAMRTTLSTTRSRASCHCPSASSRTSPEAGCPVLLTTPSMRPYLSRVPPTRVSRSDSSVTEPVSPRPPSSSPRASALPEGDISATA